MGECQFIVFIIPNDSSVQAHHTTGMMLPLAVAAGMAEVEEVEVVDTEVETMQSVVEAVKCSES